MSNAVLECERQEIDGRRPAARWLSWGVVAIYWLGMFGGTHYPTPPHAPFGNADKWMHFGAYAGLAFLVSIALGMRRSVTPLAVLAIVAALAVYGALDEVTQPIVGRDCDFWDWVADVTGVLVGAGCFQLAAWVRRQWAARPAG